MLEPKIDTLTSLLSEYKVEIPIIQRDYAQGRQDSHTKRVRTNLLFAIKEAILENTPPLDLNFIYGKVENQKFIPVDGQQRLTTLFLLHVYAFANDESRTGLLENFSYKTRKTSREFFEKLVKNRSSLFHSEETPSTIISDSEWFVTSWQFDPTVSSALVMLDAIKETFNDIENLSDKLSVAPSPLTFQFLEMENLAMEDSLYIKLNARGKPLSAFENLKAEIVRRAEKIKYPLLKEMEQNFDGLWTDMFWSRFNSQFDESFLNFFGVIFMNHGIIPNDNTDWLSSVEFEKVTKETLDTIYYSLNYLSKNADRPAFEIVNNAVSSNPTYPGRVLMHAVTTFLFFSKGESVDNFNHWLRIFKNLTHNSRIDEMEIYKRAIEGINNVSNEWNSFLSYFSSQGKMTGFSSEQIREEQIKAKFITLNPANLNVFAEAEKHPYFKGEIRSALYYAGFYDSKGDVQIFQDYWQKISLLFESNKPKYGNLLRRALLCFGDYRLPIKHYKTLCSDNPEEPNRNPSMKSLFANHGPIVKELLDSLNPNLDFEKQLNKILTESQLDKTDWRYCFVNYPELFNLMNTQFLRTRGVNGVTILVPNKESTGKNYEIFSSTLGLVLNEHGIPSETNLDYGHSQERYLIIEDLKAVYKDGKFIVSDSAQDQIVFESTSGDPIQETANYIKSIHKTKH